MILILIKTNEYYLWLKIIRDIEICVLRLTGECLKSMSKNFIARNRQEFNIKNVIVCCS